MCGVGFGLDRAQPPRHASCMVSLLRGADSSVDGVRAWLGVRFWFGLEDEKLGAVDLECLPTFDLLP